MFKIRPKFIYDVMMFKLGEPEKIKKYLLDHNMIVLRHDESIEDEMATIYYLSQIQDPKVIELYDRNFVWVDEMGEINSCGLDYLKENFDIYDENDEINENKD